MKLKFRLVHTEKFSRRIQLMHKNDTFYGHFILSQEGVSLLIMYFFFNSVLTYFKYFTTLFPLTPRFILNLYDTKSKVVYLTKFDAIAF